MIPTEEEYAQALIERHTRPVYEKLRSARVAIAGLGGLGSNIAVSLTRAGVGELLLVDFDRVEISNLNRQQYDTGDLGRLKTEALRERLLRINPYITLKTHAIRVDDTNAAEIFGSYGIVCEAFDKAGAKAMLINALLTQCPQTYIVSGSGMAGYLSANMITTRRVFERLYLCGDGVTDMADANGLMAPRVAVCANHEANMALRLILGAADA